jgi:hypothetical protein
MYPETLLILGCALLWAAYAIRVGTRPRRYRAPRRPRNW